MCEKCKNDRCIGFWLLHPKEMIAVEAIKNKELEVNSQRTFKLIESPGNLYTKFMELHTIAGPDEDLSKPLPEVKVDIANIVKEADERREAFNRYLRSTANNYAKTSDIKSIFVPTGDNKSCQNPFPKIEIQGDNVYVGNVDKSDVSRINMFNAMKSILKDIDHEGSEVN